MATRIDQLTEAQRARMDEWAERWIEIGLRTGEADWERFEAAAKECYRFAGIPWPGVVVRVPSPLVGAFAAPIALHLLRTLAGAVDGAVGGAVHGAVRDAVDGGWHQYLGGQFWPATYWGAAYTSFFREVCSLELMGDLWNRGRAWEATVESACWWWPTTRFVMVCDRPKVIHLEQIGRRGWGSHRLHCTTGPAIAWGGWELYYVHGVRVDRRVIEEPETLTAKEVLTHPNAEVRRVMIELLGLERLLERARTESGLGVRVIHEDLDQLGQPRRLLRLPLRGDEDLAMVEVVNSTEEPDLVGGKAHWKTYVLRVPPETVTCGQAVAWTFGFDSEREYAPAVES